jgi:hypothetical protein
MRALPGRSPSSGCHCRPSAYRWDGTSTASGSPSDARALMRRPAPMRRTAWWCQETTSSARPSVRRVIEPASVATPCA